MKNIILAAAILMMGNLPVGLAVAAEAGAEQGWQSLFNGKNLDGWLQLNGSAPYSVENGAIVGTSVTKSKNSFLATRKTYGDFILEFEAKTDSTLNSGVQFRSLSDPKYMNGRVHGYQLDIDTSARAWTGGIYDEGRRKWLYPLSENPRGRQAYLPEQWNKFRIEAVGTSLRTYVNGVATANLVDDETAQGFIALQVHGIGRDAGKLGKQVRWRKLRIKTDDLTASLWSHGGDLPERNFIPNHLTPRQQAEGWQLLWDGKTSNGWRSAQATNFPEQGWQIKDGVLSILAAEPGKKRGGDIVTRQEFDSFELELDFKLTKGANSGVKYLIGPTFNKRGRAVGMEYQLLDDKNHPDAIKGMAGTRTLASLYDVIAADNLSSDSSAAGKNKKRFNGIGKWNRARIVVRGAHVEHWLNGEKVVQFDRHSQVFKDTVAKSKYAKTPSFGERDKGVILLQDHSDLVSYRSIKIRRLEANESTASVSDVKEKK